MEEQQEQQQRCETMDLDEREEEEREAYEREERDEDDEDAMEQDERRAPSSKRVRIAAFSAPHGTRSTTESTRGWASSPLALRSAQPHQRHLEPLSGAGASAAPLSSDAAWAPSPALPAGRTSRKIRALEGARAAHDLLRPYSSTRAMGLGSLAGGGDPFIRTSSGSTISVQSVCANTGTYEYRREKVHLAELRLGPRARRVQVLLEPVRAHVCPSVRLCFLQWCVAESPRLSSVA